MHNHSDEWLTPRGGRSRPWRSGRWKKAQRRRDRPEVEVVVDPAVGEAGSCLDRTRTEIRRSDVAEALGTVTHHGRQQPFGQRAGGGVTPPAECVAGLRLDPAGGSVTSRADAAEP